MTGNETLIQKIKDAIREKKAIPFSEYMDMALYDPEEGYYMSSNRQFGEGGDFATSTAFHPLFGKMLGKQLAQMLESLPKNRSLSLIEMGAGEGVLSELILGFLEKEVPRLYDRTTLEVVEKSPALRKLQKVQLEKFEKEGKVVWFENLKELKTPRAPHSNSSCTSHR